MSSNWYEGIVLFGAVTSAVTVLRLVRRHCHSMTTPHSPSSLKSKAQKNGRGVYDLRFQGIHDVSFSCEEYVFPCCQCRVKVRPFVHNNNYIRVVSCYCKNNGSSTAGAKFQEWIADGVMVGNCKAKANNFPSKLNVAFVGSLSFHHGGKKFTIEKLCIGQTKECNWWIGGKKMRYNYHGNAVIASDPKNPCFDVHFSTHNNESIRVYCLQQRHDWLKSSAMSDDTLICNFNLPGTHDSGAYELARAVRSYEESSASNPSRQVFPIYEQLMYGVRVVDVRLSRNLDIIHLDHSYGSFRAVMSECAQFLQRNSEEFIVMLIKQEEAGIDLVKLSSMLRSYDDVIRLPSTNSQTWINYGKAKGKIVLLNRINDDFRLGFPLNNWDSPHSERSGHYNRNKDWFHATTFKLPIYAQDKFKDITGNVEEGKYLKWTSAAILKSNSYNMGVLNFASYSEKIVRDIKPEIGQFILQSEGLRLGWIMLDFVFDSYEALDDRTLVDIILNSNATL